MNYKLYSIKDELSGFTAPIPFINEELAKRWFKTIVNTETMKANNKDDYSLYYMGEFDEIEGTITYEEKKVKKIMKGTECNE